MSLDETLDLAMQALAIEDSPRKAELLRLADYLAQKWQNGAVPKLTVICTHNSRRSHLGQFWLTYSATRFGVELESFSGGTEATAVHPNTLAALARAGVVVTPISLAPNPHYTLGYGDEGKLEVFSKVYDQQPNPQESFAALMVCTEADGACPFVPGADARFTLPYTDPKRADGTPDEAAVYDAASQLIAGEMAWAIAKAQQLLDI